MENKQNVQEKIWGVYQTAFDPEKIEELDEIDIWKKIDNLGGEIFWAIHDFNKPWRNGESWEDITNAQYALEYLIYYTRKYGVEFSREPSVSEHVERSDSYNAWYNFWKNHFDSMSEEEYNAFVDDKFNGKDISKYMPTDTWKEHYEKTRTKK